MRLTGLVSKCAFKDWQCVANAVDRLALREPIDGLLTLRASGIVTPVQDDYNLRGRTHSMPLALKPRRGASIPKADRRG